MWLRAYDHCPCSCSAPRLGQAPAPLDHGELGTLCTSLCPAPAPSPTAATGSMANNLSMGTFVPADVHMTQVMLVMVENQALKNSRSTANAGTIRRKAILEVGVLSQPNSRKKDGKRNRPAPITVSGSDARSVDEHPISNVV